MKVLFVYPPYDKEEIFSFLSDSAPVLPPLGLAYLAGYLRKYSYPVKIIDAPGLGAGMEETVKLAARFAPDVIGITSNSALYSRARVLSKKLKEALPSVKIVFGGYHPTFLGEEVLADDYVDFIIKGEGEDAFLELCRALEQNNGFSRVRGLGYKLDGKIYMNEERDFISDLDKLPFPAYDLLPMGNYHIGNAVGRGRNTISIVASRGCTGNCYFCPAPGFWKNTYRKHSPVYVMSLMDYLYNEFRKNSFQFRDDTFTLDKKWVMDLCNLMLKNKFHKKCEWQCYSRFDSFDEEMLALMKKAGCCQVSLGVESAEEETIRQFKKFSKERVYAGMRLLKKYGMKSRLFFMVGPPSRSLEELDKIADLAIELGPDLIHLTASIPYPGSAFYKALSVKGCRLAFSSEIPKMYEGFCDFEAFTREDINLKIKEIYKKFYLRRRYLLKQVFSIRNFRDFYNLWLGGLFALRIMWNKAGAEKNEN
ncbi:MAG: radical SAM protein [Candidatus Omnitrophica bacterium]|nr:radical SAM protein [Candidatus Omnitrophota bacterium]